MPQDLPPGIGITGIRLNLTSNEIHVSQPGKFRFANVAMLTIKEIRFYGTFFGNNANLSEIESELVGVKYTKEAVREALSKLDFNNWFAGFTLDELTEAVVG